MDGYRSQQWTGMPLQQGTAHLAPGGGYLQPGVDGTAQFVPYLVPPATFGMAQDMALPPSMGAGGDLSHAAALAGLGPGSAYAALGGQAGTAQHAGSAGAPGAGLAGLAPAMAPPGGLFSAAGHGLPLEQLPASVGQQAQQAAPAGDSFPETVPVVCGTVRGVLIVRKGRILFDGQEISPTEFEKAGGRAQTKKWKTSVRVVQEGGAVGPTIGDWLAERGLDIRNNQFFRASEGGAAPARAPAALRFADLLEPEGPSEADLMRHLEAQYIGLIPGDPAAPELPAHLPASQPGITTTHLSQVAYADLMDLSFASAASPLAALLPDPPGVAPERVAYMTGQEPKRQRLEVADATRAAAEMAAYLAGARQEPPWPALGLARGPVMAGKELDLRQFHAVVTEFGGYDAACANRRWARIAERLGIDTAVVTNAAWLCRTHYQRLVLPYVQLSPGPGGAPAVAAATTSSTAGADSAPAAEADSGARSAAQAQGPASDGSAGPPPGEAAERAAGGAALSAPPAASGAHLASGSHAASGGHAGRAAGAEAPGGDAAAELSGGTTQRAQPLPERRADQQDELDCGDLEDLEEGGLGPP